MFAKSNWCVKVNDEVSEIRWECERWEEEVVWREDSSRGTIGRIVDCVDISGNKRRAMSFQHAVNSSEDSVGLGVATPAGPPPFDNSNVVAIDFESGGGAKLENKSDEKFHGDGFGPSNVPTLLFPTW